MSAPPGDMVEKERRSSLRLQTLVRLRWLAVAGQTATTVFVAFGLDFSMPIIPVFALIAALALGNLVLALKFPATQRVMPRVAFALLGFDLAQLTGLLYLTGGLANPFVPLISVRSSYPSPRCRCAMPWRCWRWRLPGFRFWPSTRFRFPGMRGCFSTSSRR